jgi:hypothetical protein
MKRIALSTLAGLGLLALVPTAAMAHTDLSVGVNLGGGYYAPQPTYVETYVAPPPVYYRDDDYRRGHHRNGQPPLSHYRQHNAWVRSHPEEGGQIMYPNY